MHTKVLKFVFYVTVSGRQCALCKYCVHLCAKASQNTVSRHSGLCKRGHNVWLHLCIVDTLIGKIMWLEKQVGNYYKQWGDLPIQSIIGFVRSVTMIEDFWNMIEQLCNSTITMLQSVSRPTFTWRRWLPHGFWQLATKKYSIVTMQSLNMKLYISCNQPTEKN